MIRVGIVRGGSTHSEESLASGGHVLRTFLEQLVGEYRAIDIFISRDGVWHVQGIPVTTERLGLFVDVLFSALTGLLPLSDEGVHLLEATTVAHTAQGSNVHSALRDYLALREHATAATFAVPLMTTLTLARTTTDRQLDDYARDIGSRMSPPYLVRPRIGDSHHDAWIVRSVADLLPTLATLRSGQVGEIVVEEYVVGDLLEVHVLPEFRTAPAHVFLPVRHGRGGVHLLTGEYRKVFEDATRGIFERLAPGTHTAVYARLHPRLGLIFTSLTTTPDLAGDSAFHQILTHNGVSFPDYLRHRVSLAKKGKKG